MLHHFNDTVQLINSSGKQNIIHDLECDFVKSRLFLDVEQLRYITEMLEYNGAVEVITVHFLFGVRVHQAIGSSQKEPVASVSCSTFSRRYHEYITFRNYSLQEGRFEINLKSSRAATCR